MRFGEHNDKIKAAGFGKNLKEPLVHSDIVYVWSAFCFLSDTRSSGDGIKLSEIKIWLDENYISNPNRRQEFIFLIHKLDKQFIKHHRDKEKNN